MAGGKPIDSLRASLTLVVGSKNPAKIRAGHAAVRHCFPSKEVLALGVDVASGVPDQPIGDDETLLGAVNRVKGLAQAWRQQHCTIYAAECRAQRGQLQAAQRQLGPGPASQLPHCTPDSMLLAVEGGVLQRGKHDLYCFAWAAAQLAGGEKVSTARSAEFLLPRRLSELVLDGMELGAADDLVFGRTSSGQGNGTVGILTSNIVSRAAYYEHAITMAMIPFMNHDLYPEFNKLY